MKVDERKEIIDLSDHNLLQVKLKSEICRKDKNQERKKIEYYKKDEQSLNSYVKEVEEECQKESTMNMEKMEKIMKMVAERKLKRVYIRREREGTKEPEPPWINEEIKQGIKKRKQLNREWRNTKDERERDLAKERYISKKREVQKSIKQEISKHEERKTREIREGRTSGKKLWEHVNKLRGREVRRMEEREVYKEGKKMSNEEAEREIIAFWKTIYQKEDNNIAEVWNTERKREYCRDYENENIKTLEVQQQRLTIPQEIAEHMDMAFRVENKCRSMRKREITDEEIRKSIEELKNGKASGPDKLKPEFFKALGKSEIYINKMKESMNKVLEEGNIPDSWTQSETVMVPKVTNPEAKDFRPISLTNISCKIFMRIIKKRIDEHLTMNKEEKEEQAGFTNGRRLEDNLFILQHCIQKTYQRRKQLLVAAVDFRKAYDYIKREKLIEALKEYKIEPNIIECIKEIYTRDKTEITWSEGKNFEIKIQNGIRQGCTGSTTLFKLITYLIIKELEKTKMGYKDENLTLNTIFFADDGLQLSGSLEEAKMNINALKEVSKKYGLELNKEKSNFMIFNVNEEIKEIEGIKVVDKIKYLGVIINNKKLCFQEHKKNMLKKAQSLANLTYSIIAKSCNKMLVGKTYWKSVALPPIMHGAGVINFNRKRNRRAAKD